VTPTGAEHTPDFSGKQGAKPQGGAESGALSGDSARIDPDLALIVNQWPTLPEATRQAVLGVDRQAAGRGQA